MIICTYKQLTLFLPHTNGDCMHHHTFCWGITTQSKVTTGVYLVVMPQLAFDPSTHWGTSHVKQKKLV